MRLDRSIAGFRGRIVTDDGGVLDEVYSSFDSGLNIFDRIGYVRVCPWTSTEMNKAI